jgi:DNA-binding XRE family transcriptional regulator
MSTITPPDKLDQVMRSLQVMASALQAICAQTGARLTRQQLAERLGVHRNTLAARLANDRTMPRPGKDGKWLLSEVIDWEMRQH